MLCPINFLFIFISLNNFFRFNNLFSKILEFFLFH
nr:MAG TPA: hypothetical protein [Caudoviricetes sp.]